MAPVRRYLRISKYSVLECRIYLDNPALAQSWLLNPRNPILPRVIESIRPFVLPKLREEKERAAKKKSAKKKQVKDVIVQDDFEVSMFLTETSIRHSLLTKHKHFREKGPGKMQSNSSKLIRETNEEPVDVDADQDLPIRIEEDSDEDGVRLADIPTANTARRSKRQRSRSDAIEELHASDSDEAASAIEVDSDAEPPPPKRLRRPGELGEDDQGDDDKKKMAMDVSFEGFAIYGLVLCLVVKKKDNKNRQGAVVGRASGDAAANGQARMENWITSTQIPLGDEPS